MIILSFGGFAGAIGLAMVIALLLRYWIVKKFKGKRKPTR